MSRRPARPPHRPAWNTAATTTGDPGEPHTQAVTGCMMLFAHAEVKMRGAWRPAELTLWPWRGGSTRGAGPRPIRTRCSRSFVLLMSRCG